MAVSKRLRFEVLRRDGHTCRYCGRGAPEVKLTVDHVVPEALGGQDVPENLVTACADCNGGKTSIAPDSPLVDEVKQDALRWSRALQEAARIRRAERHRLLAVGDAFIEQWESFTETEGGSPAEPPWLPADWREAVERFWIAGLPWEDIQTAVRLAMGNGRVLADNKFRYFCGVCWRMVGELQETATQIVDAIDDESPATQATKSKEPPLAPEVSRAMAREAARSASSKAQRAKWQA